ncbi:hypothetical protein F4811DRAFT_62838 [Daldinia bambusicola]|nr:hypothetical protein F4811DRAFT_62838 [Daldinia bambusicola]
MDFFSPIPSRVTFNLFQICLQNYIKQVLWKTLLFLTIGMSMIFFIPQPGYYIDLQCTSLLLNMPLDILFEIVDALQPQDYIAFALTCKSAFLTFFEFAKKLLNHACLRMFLIRIEGGLSVNFFFCYRCTQLHRYSHSWAPGRMVQSRLEPPCRPRIRGLGGVYIGFHHARLVMNAHFFGPGRGLNISKFRSNLLELPNDWVTSSIARIMGGQLFLRIRHQLVLNHPWLDNRNSFLKLHYNHYICRHFATHRPSRISWIMPGYVQIRSAYLLPGIIHYGRSQFTSETFDEVSGCCETCLTDFFGTIKWYRVDYRNNLLDIEIVAYHQVGNCRSPSDWKWATFAPRDSPRPLTEITRSRYLSEDHGLGAVKRRWEMAGPDIG